MCQVDRRTTARLTHLSRLHPYPAMVADELALDLVADHVAPASSVLDPFCGSGRLLAAADHASVRVGVDANPLAWLLTRAKLSDARTAVISEMLRDFSQISKIRPSNCLNKAGHGSVDWFAPEIVRDLERIVIWLNGLQLAESELFLAAATLSATVRDVSFARQNGWKLHRLGADERAVFKASVFDRFERRLRYCEKEIKDTSQVLGGVREVHLGDARFLTKAVAQQYRGLFDVVLTSPPYGDSRTTVQYGAASALCLSIVSHLCGLEHLGMLGREIDGACLGSKIERRGQPNNDTQSFKRYWAGSFFNASYRPVATFLLDYRKVCAGIVEMLRPGGKAILVVGRRSTGGYRLKLDDFTADELEAGGMKLIERYERELQHKRLPRLINRFGRSLNEVTRSRGRLTTMSKETVLVLQK
jgi:site-specific DNA-methyltransferase (cytosine-N4-specific)